MSDSEASVDRTAPEIASPMPPALSGPPRLPPLAPEELTDELVTIVSRMVAVNQAIDARDKEMLADVIDGDAGAMSAAARAAQLANLPEIVRTMLRHPDLFACQAEMSIQLLSRGTLPARDRELAVLRIAWLCRAPYEWGEHVHVAHNVGIASAEIERITQGCDASGWSERDAVILRAVDELHGQACITDATWETLARHFDERQLIELPVVVGQYQAVAYYQNSLRLRLHEGNPGLAAR